MLHSAIATYIEQQYHNFAESSFSLFSEAYSDVYLQENALFEATDSLLDTLESARVAIFSFDSVPKIAKDNQKPKKTAKKKPKAKPKQTMAKSAPKPIIAPSPSPDSAPIDSATIIESTPKAPMAELAPSTQSADSISPPLNNTPLEAIKPTKPTIAESSLADSNLALDSSPTIESEPSYTPIRPINNPRISIDEGSLVLLIGDSMMQGVAPHLLKTFKKVNVEGINLSKHSTGLTYKHYFDWEAAIRASFEKYPNISLVVVLLGANDPWNMKKVATFRSEKWESIYTERIAEIVDVVQENGAQIVWYEVPSVREKSLNTKLIYLNSLYEREVRGSGGYFLQTNGIITQGGTYSSFIKNNGKSIRVRDDDGVHFSTIGYQIMANILLNNLSIKAIDSKDRL